MSYKSYMSIMGGVCLAMIILIAIAIKCTTDDLSAPTVKTSANKELKVVYQQVDTEINYPKPEYTRPVSQAIDTEIKEDRADDSGVEVQQ